MEYNKFSGMRRYLYATENRKEKKILSQAFEKLLNVILCDSILLYESSDVYFSLLQEKVILRYFQN